MYDRSRLLAVAGIFAAAVSYFSLAGEARAVWVSVHATPEVEALDDGMIRVKAVRTKPDDDAQLDRSARLRVFDENGEVLSTTLSPTESDDGERLIYSFELRESLKKSFTLSIYEKPTRLREVVGGGEIYEYSLRNPLELIVDVKSIELPSKEAVEKGIDETEPDDGEREP